MRRSRTTRHEILGNAALFSFSVTVSDEIYITDKLKSYGAAKREILPGVEHPQHKRLNNRSENSHQSTRLRERKMRRFKSAKQAQRFLSSFGPISGHFQPRRHLMNAQDYRAVLQDRFQVWYQITGVKLVG